MNSSGRTEARSTEAGGGLGRRRPGGRSTWRGSLRVLGLVTLPLAAGCAFGPGARVETTPPPGRAEVDRAVRALEAAEAEYEAERYESAARQADSLFAAWGSRSTLAALADRALWLGGRSQEALGLPGRAGELYDRLIRRARPGSLRQQALARYATVLAGTGREPEAVALVLEEPGALDEDALDDYRAWVSAISINRVRGFATSYPPESAEAAVIHVQLARLLAAGGEAEEARRIARRVLAARPAPAERELAELLAAEAGAAGTRVKIGAILPQTGALANIGELLRQGIELAVDGYRRARPDGFELELVVRDDASDPERAAELVGALEREGVVAIIGPLRSESFAAAARARKNERLPIISPTATEVFGSPRDAYSLNDRVRLAQDNAADLGTWAVTELGVRRLAILASGDRVGAGAARAFEEAARAAGGTVVAHAAFDPSQTTFREPIEAVARAEPDAVFVPVTSASTLLTLAPQLFYYGLDRSIVIGNETWADPQALRRLESFATDYRVVGLSVDRVTEAGRWQRFVSEYERTFRRPLGDEYLPGLAYDATALALGALDGGGLPIPAALSSFLASGPRIEGVTGTLQPEARSSTVKRATDIRMVVSGALREADRSELLGWLAEARAAPPRGERGPFQR